MRVEDNSAQGSCTSSGAIRLFVCSGVLKIHVGPVTRNADKDAKLPRYQKHSLTIRASAKAPQGRLRLQHVNPAFNAEIGVNQWRNIIHSFLTCGKPPSFTQRLSFSLIPDHLRVGRKRVKLGLAVYTLVYIPAPT